jgi:outer membrane receptor protein involved in Fe transport
MVRRRHFAEILASSLLAICSSGWASAQQALPTIEVGRQAPRRPAPGPAAAAPAPAPATPVSQPVTAESPILTQPKAPDAAASVKTFTGEQVNALPFSRPGDALEVVPGLVVSQHSGEGKANQYNLRGFQLDHGTDLALWLDGMPLNMRTHGHGQGYADANFLIPELLSTLLVRKGPYFADEGDFSSAGAIHMQYIDKLSEGLLLATGGSFGYGRLLSVKSYDVNGGSLLAALEENIYNGPWTRPDELRKINSVMRWSRGTQEDGLSITGMAYANRWYSTDQIPERAVNGGIIPLWGNIDRTDGGDTTRFSLSGRWSQVEGNHASRVEAYVIRSTLDLYNNFTYFLTHQDLGDQFRQFDHRTLFGVNAVHSVKHNIADFPIETRVGFQGRYDNIRVGLQETVQRQNYDAIRNDYVNEGSFSFWTDSTVFWTPWFRTTGGFRFDYLHADVNGLQNLWDAPKVLTSTGDAAFLLTGPFNSGSKGAAITSPKAGAVIGPFYNTELFLNFGEGFHSTDARGTVQNFDTTALSGSDGFLQVARNPLLVKSRGAEIGARTKFIEGLDSSISLWWLNFDSENQFQGDTGTTIFGRPSRRYGIEITNHYSPSSWLHFEGDVALVHARYRGVDQLQTLAWVDLLGPASFPYGTFIGNAAGNFIPEAKSIVATAGLEAGEKTGWFGALKYRYFGAQPLTEDGAFKGPATGILNARLGYRFNNGWSVRADAFNVFNSRSDQITYGYGSLLPTDQLFNLCRAGVAPGNVCAIGVMDRHFHPVEPPAVRVTVSGPLPF